MTWQAAVLVLGATVAISVVFGCIVGNLLGRSISKQLHGFYVKQWHFPGLTIGKPRCSDESEWWDEMKAKYPQAVERDPLYAEYRERHLS